MSHHIRNILFAFIVRVWSILPIYAGSERLATVIGGGGFGAMTTPIESLTTDEYNDLVAPFWDRYSPHTEDPFSYSNALSEEVVTLDINKNADLELQYHCHSMPLEYVDALYQDNILFSAIHDYQQELEIEKDIYFYHGDHLGSANWITDAFGDPVQYIHYAPYGELLANQQTIGYDERYKFTGKERDWETGYDMFGARYLWSATGHWLSVDPLVDKYLWISPYAYAAWNPIKNKDPNGMWVHIAVGAAIGATINGAYALSNGKSWSEVGSAALGGAVAGGIVAATAGAATSIAATTGIVDGVGLSTGLGIMGGSIGGAMGNLAEQGVNVGMGNQQNIDGQEVITSAITGAVVEGIGGFVNGIVSKSLNKLSGYVSKSNHSNGAVNNIRKEISNEQRRLGNNVSNRKLDKMTKQRIENLNEADMKAISGADNIITQGITPSLTNSIENEIK